MRFIKSFMLHLYVDSEDPERQCGDLQAVSDRKSQLFKNQSELINLLQESIRQSFEELQTKPNLNNQKKLKENNTGRETN